MSFLRLRQSIAVVLGVCILGGGVQARVVGNHGRGRNSQQSSPKNLRRGARGRKLMGGDMGGGGGNDRDNNEIDRETFVGYTSFADNMNGGGMWLVSNIKEDQINEHGVAETKPCIPWSEITNNQQINPSSDDECRDLSAGYPYGGGCCRSYWWLIYDPTGVSSPSVKCICNQFTSDPSTFTNAPQPNWLTPSPTSPPPTTPPPTTPPPTTPPPTTPPPTTPPPTTPVPAPADPAPAEPAPAEASASFPEDHCLKYENLAFWDKTAYPQYADKTRCTLTDHCPAGSCCLGSICMCGIYVNALSQCVMVDSTTTDRTDEQEEGTTSEAIVTVDPEAPPADICSVPENNLYWHDPFYSEKIQCTTSSDDTCGNNVDGTCCLAQYCMCGKYWNEVKDCVP